MLCFILMIKYYNKQREVLELQIDFKNYKIQVVKNKLWMRQIKLLYDILGILYLLKDNNSNFNLQESWSYGKE